MEMEDPPQAVQSASRKRPFEDDADVPVSTPDNNGAASDGASTPLTVLSTIATPSPVKQSRHAMAPQSSGNSVAINVAATTASSTGTQPAKRRKLTPQEQEEKRREKEAKDKAKADQKAQKEEEKRMRDEEKRRKNEEREEKRRAKELEQQQKEEEKRKKEEEKLKKERSQMRLNAFFAKPKTDGGNPGFTLVDTNQNTNAQTVSLVPDVPVNDANPGPVSPQKAIRQRATNDYERYFLPFQLPSHAIMAPYNRYMEDPAKMASAKSRLDQLLSQGDVGMVAVDLDSVKSKFPSYRARGRNIGSIVEIVERLNNSSDQPIDLTKEDGSSDDPLALLKQVPVKYLHFPEDVRPPYYGTYTKPHTPRETAKLARAPFSRTLQEADYDYDSEAEWDEPEEGEDLDSEGDDDLDEEGEDDMEGFLDDEEDAQVKRRLINGDLQPVSTGLCWEDTRGVSKLNDGSGAISTEFKEFRMGFLLDPRPQAIDPFSTAYWAPNPTVAVTTLSVDKINATSNSIMQPPRMPLSQRPMNSMLNTLNSSPNDKASSAGGKPAKPPKRLIPADQLSEFKSQVEGSDLTKIALVEALKKKFPKVPKDAISNTLSAVAARVGAKEVDKRWVLL